MEGLRSIEYEINESAEGFESEPFPRNAKRLERLKVMSDVLAPHGAEFLFSYHSLSADEEAMDLNYRVYERLVRSTAIGTEPIILSDNTGPDTCTSECCNTWNPEHSLRLRLYHWNPYGL